MNLFVTHASPVTSAQNHCDVHLIKMILEAAQLLSCAHIVLDGNQVAYKKSHENHPCAIWIRASAANYMWGWNLLNNLCEEYVYRFGYSHATSAHLEALKSFPINIDTETYATPFVCCVTDDVRVEGDVPESYRRYIQAKMLEWKSREKPMRTCFTKRQVPEFLKDYCDQR